MNDGKKTKKIFTGTYYFNKYSVIVVTPHKSNNTLMSSNPFQYTKKLDDVFLNSLYEDDLEYAIISFEQFLKICPVQLNDIEESFKAGDIDTFRNKIHKAKPIFSYVGLTTITAKADAVEKMCLNINYLQQVEDRYQEFKTCVAQLLPVVQEELIRMKT